MESSEDDAGAAAYASRRASAREKDIGQIEDVNATSSFQQDSSNPRTSCETPAMSEENFDGDSVPSPSTQDVNTSTEAILDMIDEIVDGPGAPKRLPLASEKDTDHRFAGGGEANIVVDEIKEDEKSLQSFNTLSTTSAKIEDVQNCELSVASEQISQNDVLVDVKVVCNKVPETCSSALEINDLTVAGDTRSDLASSCEEPNSSSVQNIPLNSVTQTVQNQIDTDTDSAPCERTVKSVTSSDIRDNVIVESAESTSSDNSISEGKSPLVESATRSPLRRRLVRPATIRPDSTVSSTVDSTLTIDTTEQASECVVKDVSSSSDAVSSACGNVKQETIRNESDSNLCKPETSSSPAKKIKLIRPKIIPQTFIVQKETKVETALVQRDTEQCQPTSSELVTITVELSSESVECVNISKTDSEINSSENTPVASSSKINETETQNVPTLPKKEESLTPTTSSDIILPEEEVVQKPPHLVINLIPSNINESVQKTQESETNCDDNSENSEKQVPKLMIKLGKHSEEIKPPVPKLTIKPIRHPSDIDCSTSEKLNDDALNIPKLNIKPVTKKPEKIYEIHRKSSSSEISESEYSENDESASTSDQASTSDHGSTDVIPKVTIRLGKPGTESEGQFYTERNIPKISAKTIQNNDYEHEQLSPTKMKIFLSQNQDKQSEKIPKLTIKTVVKCESQPLSPRLTIKPLKPPDDAGKESPSEQGQGHEISKLKKSSETNVTSSDSKDLTHVPKIIIKPVTNPEIETIGKSKKPNENFELIPVVTKLNIKPVIKPSDSIESSETLDKDKVPVVSKLNIKPIVKPKDSDLDSSKEVPKIMKLNIKLLKNADTNSSEEKDCDDKADLDENSIPVITKLNIKPIVKPLDEDKLKDNDNQSSETGNSSDDNNDHIPIVTKINIKPICKPNDMEESGPSLKKEDNIPVVTKLNIKPLIKPDDTLSPLSPKKELLKSAPCSPKRSPTIKLNIKPIVKPEEPKQSVDTENDETIGKNPPILMKINRKTGDTYINDDQYSVGEVEDHKISNSIHDNCPVISKVNIKAINKSADDIYTKVTDCNEGRSSINDRNAMGSNELKLDQTLQRVDLTQNCITQFSTNERKLAPKEDSSVSAIKEMIADSLKKQNLQEMNMNSSFAHSSLDPKEGPVKKTDKDVYSMADSKVDAYSELLVKIPSDMTKNMPRQNCTLLKKLLETRKDKLLDDDSNKKQMNKSSPTMSHDMQKSPSKHVNITNDFHKEKGYSEIKCNISERISDEYSKANDVGCSIPPLRVRLMQELCIETNENLSKSLQIDISDKVTSHSPDQDSPRIILKINKTDQGTSAEIITEDIKKSEQQQCSPDNTQIMTNDLYQKKKLANCRRKTHIDTPMPMGKRLRSSRVLQTSEKTSTPKKNMGKRPSGIEISPPQIKEQEISVLDSKRLKLGQLLSNKSLTITPIVSKACSVSPTKTSESKQVAKNHSLLNNENCAKNGSSKLHNILSNLQAKQLQGMPFSDINHAENNQNSSPDMKSSTSTGSLELISDNSATEKTRPEVHEMLFHDNSESHDFSIGPEEVARDPLEVDSLKIASDIFLHENIPKTVEMTPQPKKRGRPRKIPVSEGTRVVTLPATALEERPQRSLRLSRDRPVIIVKPRGRGRGRGRRLDTDSDQSGIEPVVEAANKYFIEQKPEDIDPTSSRIKLPRMTEALDKMPCSTPLSSRRRTSSSESYTGLDTTLPKMEDPFLKSPELVEMRGRGSRGRGSRGGRGRVARSPRGRGRGRGGGRGAMYMKETMGIYGRVCGPATTTVQLFEEETCMMDDNATPAKPSHLLDEDSQSSVKSLTNDSSRMRKSKFADLFDSNKVWTAADVKEYMWPPPETTDGEHQVMMIQEQVAMFLGVKSFKRRYPELKRRTIVGEERDYVLSKGLVTEALCDLGITAVDASEVLDIMLSDYPHKYEEFRSHQREKQLAEPADEVDDKTELNQKVEIKETKLDSKPEPPKIDPEKTRQDMAAAAIASASEFNARMNMLRRPACADLQSLSVCRRRPAPPPPVLRVAPPGGFYPHALLPGQYQHTYRVYTPEELRYFPLNTALAAPPAPCSDSSSDSEADWADRCSSSEQSDVAPASAKRKKLTKTKRVSQTETVVPKEEEVDTCRACKMRIEANRKYTHERFLVCSNCNAKLHPSCVELGPDTIRKCREYAWQCAECKTCCACSRPADDDKMLFCDLCDRGFHIYCVGLHTVPNGRWHCVECSVCKSCGSRSAGGPGGGPGDWHHQTRRGPGGHKLYSHSLCTPCARAYRIGRYCPLCDRSFIGPKGTMQLVICKLCDRQLHQDCVKQTTSRLKVLDYTCGECRRGGITSRAAAVRLAPRTIATLFMAKRRFNKYAHRQYLESRARNPHSNPHDPGVDNPDDPLDVSDPLV